MVYSYAFQIVSLRDQIRRELYGQGHFGWDKTLALVSADYYWPKLTGDVERYLERWFNCQRSKVAKCWSAWWPIAWRQREFCMGLPRTQMSMDSIILVVDRFSNMTDFVACTKTIDTTQIAHLYFQDIVRMHGILRSITSDRDAKCMNHFWKSLWEKMGDQA
jgi:hypothetical protein